MEIHQFKDEIKEQLEVAESLLGCEMTHKDDAFRKWRHSVESLVAKFTESGYQLPGEFRSSRRKYRATWPTATKNDNVKALEKDLKDSIIELKFVLDYWGKYGTSFNSHSAPENTELSVPNKVTLAWLWNNVSYKLWLSFAGLIIFVFGLGVKAGQAKWFVDILNEILSVFK